MNNIINNIDKFPKGAAWMGGNYMDISEAKIPVLDWGFLRSLLLLNSTAFSASNY